MRKIFLSVLTLSFVLSHIGDADARKRHRRHVKKTSSVQVVFLSKAGKTETGDNKASVFETGTQKEAAPYAWVGSATHAYAASVYSWKAAEIFPPMKVEWIHASEVSSMDKETLMHGEKTYHRRVIAIMWVVVGVMLGCLVGLTGVYFWPIREDEGKGKSPTNRSV